jgi:hydrogenase-1 operon protein HyaF
MAYSFMRPPTGFGPGSQPGEEEGADLDYMSMPSGMRTFEPHFPHVDDPARIAPAIEALRHLAALAGQWTAGSGNLRFEVPDFDKENAKVFADALGEGEVAVRIDGDPRVEAQESVFAGVWRIREVGISRREHIEIGIIPTAVFGGQSEARPVPPMPAPGVVNGPYLVDEIMEHVDGREPGGAPHVVNLTLMPHTPEDLDYLAATLGQGQTTILSRGYGNCRIETTAYPDVWRVRYYNSQDVLILDSIEVSDIPEVACAAPEDIRDSAVRIAEVADAMA